MTSSFWGIAWQRSVCVQGHIQGVGFWDIGCSRGNMWHQHICHIQSGTGTDIYYSLLSIARQMATASACASALQGFEGAKITAKCAICQSKERPVQGTVCSPDFNAGSDLRRRPLASRNGALSDAGLPGALDPLMPPAQGSPLLLGSIRGPAPLSSVFYVCLQLAFHVSRLQSSS